MTALSQTRNLFFVAYGARVYVYTPQFPSQRIPEQPAVIISPPTSKPGLQGYLDEYNPHALNQIVVGELGTEEILVCVHDDGDVVVYMVRTIASAISRKNSGPPDAEFDDVRPFRVENVGMSAWGIAIHKTSRQIAISANTHDITVFSFGLVDGMEDSEIDSDESRARRLSRDENVIEAVFQDGNPRKRQRKSLPAARLQDKTYTLKGHENNIPTVAFCNERMDPEGRYLVSTDIDGYVVLWDIPQERELLWTRLGNVEMGDIWQSARGFDSWSVTMGWREHD